MSSAVDRLRVGTILVAIATWWALRLVFDGFVDATLLAGGGGDLSGYYENFEDAGRWIAPLIALTLGGGIYLVGLALIGTRDVASTKQADV